MYRVVCADECLNFCVLKAGVRAILKTDGFHTELCRVPSLFALVWLKVALGCSQYLFRKMRIAVCTRKRLLLLFFALS